MINGLDILLFSQFSIWDPTIIFNTQIMAKGQVSNGTQTVKGDLEHDILFHEQTLIVLQQNRNLKKPCTSLQVRSLRCLNQQDQVNLLSSFEIKSLERAIHRKKCLIEELIAEFNDIPEREWHLYKEPRWNILNEHRKKLTKN